MAEPKSEKKVWKVRHGTFRGDYLEHTYGEAGIKVVKGIATCHSLNAAKALVQMRGYDWLDEKDDPTTEAYKAVEAKREDKKKGLGTRIKEGVKKVGETLSGNKKASKEKSKPKE